MKHLILIIITEVLRWVERKLRPGFNAAHEKSFTHLRGFGFYNLIFFNYDKFEIEFGQSA
jgi:hypothetical protein